MYSQVHPCKSNQHDHTNAEPVHPGAADKAHQTGPKGSCSLGMAAGKGKSFRGMKALSLNSLNADRPFQAKAVFEHRVYHRAYQKGKTYPIPKLLVATP